jgi:hypothetical protein
MAEDLIPRYDDTPSARAALDVAIELVIIFAYAQPGTLRGRGVR